MQNIFWLLALLSLPALAAPPVASEFEKKITKARSWDDYTKQLKGLLPTNVVKEFADFAEDVPFPGTRRIKNTLVLTQTDGTRLSLVFKKDGKIAVNGKDWRFNPLGTPEDEITKLAVFIAGEKKASVWSLIPSAQAAAALDMGAATAAFAGGNAWKSTACKGRRKGLTDELVRDCPLMAGPMQPILASASGEEEDPMTALIPTEVNCPKEPDQKLTVLSENLSGLKEKLVVEFNQREPKTISIETKVEQSDFEPFFFIDYKKENEEIDVEIGKNVMKSVRSMLSEYCYGSAKNSFGAKISANKDALKKPSRKEDSSKPSIDAA